MKDIIKVFYDLETTGLSPKKHSIHQIAGLVEINGKEVQEFDFKTRPHPKAILEPEALRIGGVTETQIMAYPEMSEVYLKLTVMLSKYIDKFDRTDKAWLVGYNNRSFDDPFLRSWFEQNDDPYLNSWFWSDSLDVFVLASQYLIKRRAKMVNFKLSTVAAELGITVEKSKLHDGSYDIELTRQIYNIVTGAIEEI